MTVFELQRVLTTLVMQDTDNGMLPVYVSDGQACIQSADAYANDSIYALDDCEGGDLLDEEPGFKYFLIHA